MMNPRQINFKFRKAGSKDSKDLFDWRNNETTRKNSFNMDAILWSDHVNWFSNRIRDPNTTIFMVYVDDIKIGSIRFEENENTYRVSVVLAPEYTGKGVGPEVIRSGTELFLKRKKGRKPVIAEVKENNVASIKAFKRAGFKKRHIVFEFSNNPIK